MDPAPLARHGLVADLLQRLSSAGAPAPGSSLSATPGSLSATPETKSSPSISTVISLLSTLCRGSPGITHDLLRSELPESIENALQGDERCASASLAKSFCNMLKLAMYFSWDMIRPTPYYTVIFTLPSFLKIIEFLSFY